jgi:threonine synthase
MAEARQSGWLSRTLHLFCAQQASCAPMALAFESEREARPMRRVVNSPRGAASALLLGDPFTSYDFVASCVRESGGGFVTVTDEEIYSALRGQPDLPIGTSAAVGLAAVPKVVSRLALADDEVMLVMLTGGPGR